MTSGGKSSSAPGVAIFIRELLTRKEYNYGMARIAMGQKHWSYFDMFELDKIAESLKMQKAIREEFVLVDDEGKPCRGGKNKELWWFLEKRVVERYEQKIVGSRDNGN
jgi:hypothetical protein